VDLPGLGVGALDEQPRHNRRVHDGAVCSDWVSVAAEWALLTWLRRPTCTSATELLLVMLVSGKSFNVVSRRISRGGFMLEQPHTEPS
jgi:hypothetical protein